jgi:hypothetical protein
MLCTVSFVASLSGCGADGPTRIPLRGTITRGGQAIGQASLSMTPAAGHRGLAANIAIQKGHYQFSRDNGPSPGPYEVIIHEYLSKDEVLKRKKTKEFVPPTQWKFQINVPDSGSPTRDFRLDEP